MIRTIMLDMDDVLVDFSRGYCKHIGVDYERVYNAYLSSDGWSPNPALSERVMKLDKPLTAKQFYAPLERDAPFWYNLQSMVWTDRLIALCRRFTQDIWIVSAPGPCPSSYSGKVTWIKRMFGKEFDKFHLTPHKERLALPGSVLIDDCPHNVNKFIGTGLEHGFDCDGITFPQPYNEASQWATCEDVRLDYIERQLTKIARS